MDPFVFTFPADIQRCTYFEHEGEELIFILNGTVEFEIAGKVVGLKQRIACILIHRLLIKEGRSVTAVPKLWLLSVVQLPWHAPDTDTGNPVEFTLP